MKSLMFVLPVGGGSGGAHSVMQEADAMWKFGVEVTIASNAGNAPKLRTTYADLETIHQHILAYDGPAELGRLIERHTPDVVIATTNQSVHVLAEALKASKLKSSTRTAYYVQDYEPLFYEPKSEDWLTAQSSYAAIPAMIHFAKTRWLQEVVEANHGVTVYKVEPSIDHGVYYPKLVRREPDRKLKVAAMLRPSTPRRAPRRTVRIMNQLAEAHASDAVFTVFGCESRELEDHGFTLPGIEHVGILSRIEVGDLFRTTDLFLDLSDYQAFGRTAIEAMSCGCVSIVPAHGGAYEFALDGQNSFVVDTRSDALVAKAVEAFFAMSPEERSEMSMAAIRTGFEYTPERAALSEIKLFQERV